MRDRITAPEPCAVRDEVSWAAGAKKALDPVANSAGTIPCFSVNTPGFELSFRELVGELERQCAAVSRGDLERPEAMLTAQAHTLDAIFCYLLTSAREQMGHSPDKFEQYMRLALRAQQQCRSTIQSLSVLRSPPTIIAQQANVTSGPQQVSNTVALKTAPNELLEQTHGKRLDFAATCSAGSSNSQMEAVGVVYRAENDGR